MSGNPGSPAQTSSVRCVLWHSADGELPGDLLTSLSRRVGRMLVCTDQYAAFAEACLIERERRATTVDGNAAVSGVLLLVNPASLAGAADLIEAAKLYAPSVSRWSYQRDANPRLRAIVESDVESWTAKPVASPPGPPSRDKAPERPADRAWPGQRVETPFAPVPRTPASRADGADSEAFPGATTIAGPRIPPRLKISGTAENVPASPINGSLPSPAPSPAPSRQRSSRSTPLLTEQELSMLLSSEDDLAPEGTNGSHAQSPRAPKVAPHSPPPTALPPGPRKPR